MIEKPKRTIKIGKHRERKDEKEREKHTEDQIKHRFEYFFVQN